MCPSVAVGSALALAHGTRLAHVARGPLARTTLRTAPVLCSVRLLRPSSSGLPWSGLAHTTRRAFVAARRCRWSRAGRSRTRYAHAGRTSYGSQTVAGRDARRRSGRGRGSAQDVGRRSTVSRTAIGIGIRRRPDAGRGCGTGGPEMRAHTRVRFRPRLATPAQQHRPVSSLRLTGRYRRSICLGTSSRRLLRCF